MNIEQRKRDKKTFREWTLIIVTAAVVIAAVAQWYVFKQQLQIGNAATVSVSNIALKNFGGKTSEGDPYWLFIPHIENSGNTPTQRLVVKYGFELNTGASEDNEAWDHIWHGKTFHTQYTSIGPHITIPGYTVQTNGWFLNQMVAGKASAYLAGEATYNDVFGRGHITQFCLQAVIPIRDYGDSTIRTVLISIPQCAAHNCIDDECTAPTRR